MISICMLQETPIEPEKLGCKMAFCMDTMAFNQWLGTQAIREFDGYDEAGNLESLCEFNSIFEGE